MSEKNSAGKRAARERLAAERLREESREKRFRLLKVLGVSVAVLAVVGVVGYAAGNSGGSDGPEHLASGDGPAAAPVVVGDEGAPAVLTVYEDFRCPGCGELERAIRPTMQQLEADGLLRAEYHMVAILDGEGSGTAANAAACANDAGYFDEYHGLLFDNQPTDGTDRFADEDFLFELASEVDGLDTPGFRSCVTDGSHRDRVERATSDFVAAGHLGTPTVLLNGESVFGDPEDPLTPERLTERVTAIAAAEAEAAETGPEPGSETETQPDAVEEPADSEGGLENGTEAGERGGAPPAGDAAEDAPGDGAEGQGSGAGGPAPAPGADQW